MLTLVLAFLVVVVTIATDTGGSGDKSGGGETTEAGGPTGKGQRAIDKGVWVVGEGDTLVSIAEETGIDLDELVGLNPDIDPQVLSTGQRIALRQGLSEGGSDSASGSEGTTINEGAGIGDGTGN